MSDNKITIANTVCKSFDYQPAILSGVGTLTDLYNKVKEAYEKCENPDKVIVGTSISDVYQYFYDNAFIDDECDDPEFIAGPDPMEI